MEYYQIYYADVYSNAYNRNLRTSSEYNLLYCHVEWAARILYNNCPGYILYYSNDNIKDIVCRDDVYQLYRINTK